MINDLLTDNKNFLITRIDPFNDIFKVQKTKDICGYSHHSSIADLSYFKFFKENSFFTCLFNLLNDKICGFV